MDGRAKENGRSLGRLIFNAARNLYLSRRSPNSQIQSTPNATGLTITIILTITVTIAQEKMEQTVLLILLN